MIDGKTIPKFTEELPILPRFIPEMKVEEGIKIPCFNIDICEFKQQILPQGYPASTVWGYGGDCATSKGSEYQQWAPGPSFVVERGKPICVTWHNKLIKNYLFKVDPTIEWANPKHLTDANTAQNKFQAQGPVPSVVHLHGGAVPPKYDGDPLSWFTSNHIKGPTYQTRTFTYNNSQESTMLWYHSHTMGVNRLNVYAGLAGAYIIKDPQNAFDHPENKYLPSGKYDIPLVIQDKSFNEDGSLYYPEIGVVPQVHPYWVNLFFGNTITVNGKTWPNLEVEQQLYRFRVLNGSNTRSYVITLTDDREMIQIGTDGGYINHPNPLRTFILAPAERIDILIDFSNEKAGSKIIMKNSGEEIEKGTTDTIMQFNVISTSRKHQYQVPETLNDIASLYINAPKVWTTLHEKPYVVAGESVKGKSLGMFIDGQLFNNPPSNFTRIGSCFYWEYINLTGKVHPMHLHLIQFQVVGRQSFDVERYKKDWEMVNGTIPLDKPAKNIDPMNYLIGKLIPPRSYELGWKDTVQSPPGYITRVCVRYAPTTIKGPTKLGENLFPFNPIGDIGYVFHCHTLEHEDNSMMRQQFITD